MSARETRAVWLNWTAELWVRRTPTLAQATMESPEQSQPPIPSPPQTYGSPKCVRASATTSAALGLGAGGGSTGSVKVYVIGAFVVGTVVDPVVSVAGGAGAVEVLSGSVVAGAVEVVLEVVLAVVVVLGAATAAITGWSIEGTVSGVRTMTPTMTWPGVGTVGGARGTNGAVVGMVRCGALVLDGDAGIDDTGADVASLVVGLVSGAVPTVVPLKGGVGVGPMENATPALTGLTRTVGKGRPTEGPAVAADVVAGTVVAGTVVGGTVVGGTLAAPTEVGVVARPEGTVQPGWAFGGTVPPGSGSEVMSDVGTGRAGAGSVFSGTNGAVPGADAGRTGGTAVGLTRVLLVRGFVAGEVVLDAVPRGAAVGGSMITLETVSAVICTASTRAKPVVLGVAAPSAAGRRVSACADSPAATGTAGRMTFMRRASVGGVASPASATRTFRRWTGATAASASRITSAPAMTIPTTRPRAIFMTLE